MNKRSRVVLSCAMLCACSVPAQTIYRCGNSYSQTPCSGGQVVEAQDSRDRTQKQQAELATRRDAKAAQQLEKQRTQQEAALSRSVRQSGGGAEYYAPPYDPGREGYDPVHKGGRKQEFFTARSTDGHPPAKKGAQKKGKAE